MRGRHGGWTGSWSQQSGGEEGGPGWRRGGPPPWVTGLFGGGPSWTAGGPKVRRGDVRAAILDVLAAEPMNGYQIINQIAERTGGAWKPSPGSVYPTLQQLEDEGLVEAITTQGRQVKTLTESGRAYVDEHPDEMAATWRPFDQTTPPDDSATDMKPAVGQVLGAAWQLMTSGSPAQQAEAVTILAETRRRLYGLLADGDEPS